MLGQLKSQHLCVHPEQVLDSIGQFEGSNLRLFNFSACQMSNRQRSLGSQALSAPSCPPEASKIFHKDQAFCPTVEADMWQFGCLVYVTICELCAHQRSYLSG